MAIPSQKLSFEKPIYELEAQLEQLRSQANSPEVRDEALRLQLGVAELTKKIYANLSAWETVEVARHPDRPKGIDYINMVFDEFVELHGDKRYGDDRTILTGFVRLDDFRAVVIAQNKGRNFKERQEANFGMAHPEGYHKAIEKMKLAAKFKLPVIVFIDTPGAYPGIESEERGVGRSISDSMYEMALLKTPIVCVVIGEGGSGGACGIGLGNRVGMLRYAYYSVISPEGCAGILWKSGEYKDKAAEALKFTAPHLLEFGVIDDIIEEPIGGAHRDHRIMALNLKKYLKAKLKELSKLSDDELLTQRYERIRKIGVFLEESSSDAANAGTETADASQSQS